MERKFRINWADIVHEAKNRRLKQKFTQERLAKVAGVSTPTLSRFENLDKDIQLSSALAILGVLGLMDERRIDFPHKSCVYLPDCRAVLFEGLSGDQSIKCLISWDALADHYDFEGRKPIEVFKENRYAMEHAVRRKCLAGALEKDGSVFIRTEDL